MGILNVTPDSFYTKGRQKNIPDFLSLAEHMLKEGASILDIGAMSTRPGAEEVSEEEELQRLIPVLQAISRTFPDAVLSVDTYRSVVANEALHHGAHIINDISGGTFDHHMMDVVHDHKACYILMHIRGNFQQMHNQEPDDDIIEEEMAYFRDKLKLFQKEVSVCLDPGFGFGKTLPQNFQLLNRLQSLTVFQKPLLVGLSRKSMIYKTLNTDADHALNGTTALHMLALQNGANILRVHDVKEAFECITLFNQLSA